MQLIPVESAHSCMGITLHAAFIAVKIHWTPEILKTLSLLDFILFFLSVKTDKETHIIQMGIIRAGLL